MDAPPARPLDGDGALLLDCAHQGSVGSIGVYLIPQSGAAGRSGRFDLVEAGPEVDHERVEAGVRAAGYDPAAVDRLLVTHVHLDHAGAAGVWARRHGARVSVLRPGATHLLDPSRLLASAARVYGDAMRLRWGDVPSVPAELLDPVDDGDELDVGGRRVRVLATPGHAKHQAAFVWPNGAVYVGDAAGVRFAPWPVVRPTVPPPEIDLEAWDATFSRLRALQADELRLTHFGPFRDVDAHLDAAQRATHAWASAALAWADDGATRAEAIARCDAMARAELEAIDADDATIAHYLATSDAGMSVDGLERYWRTHHRERWPGWRTDA